MNLNISLKRGNTKEPVSNDNSNANKALSVSLKGSNKTVDKKPENKEAPMDVNGVITGKTMSENMKKSVKKQIESVKKSIEQDKLVTEVTKPDIDTSNTHVKPINPFSKAPAVGSEEYQKKMAEYEKQIQESQKKIDEMMKKQKEEEEGNKFIKLFEKLFDMLEAANGKYVSDGEDEKETNSTIATFLTSILQVLDPKVVQEALEEYLQSSTELVTKYQGFDIEKDGEDKMIDISLKPFIKTKSGETIEISDSDLEIGIPISKFKNIIENKGINLSELGDDGKYIGFISFAAKTANKKDIDQGAESQKTIMLIASNGDLLTDDLGNIICVEKIDEHSVSESQVVSSSWLRNQTAQVKAIEDAEVKKGTKELDIQKQKVPVGAAPQYQEEVAESVSEDNETEESEDES